MKFKLMDALKQIELEKGLAVETVLDALKDALLTAYTKNYRDPEEEIDARIDIDEDTGDISVFENKPTADGGTEEVEVTPSNFGRIAAQTAKQVITQRIREAERELMFDEYHGREGDIVTGIVQQSDQRYTLVDLGKVEALLPPSEQVRGERYEHGSRIKTYIVDVRRTTKGPQIMVSRTHPGLLKRLFELEVPEIYDGLVEIKAVAREGGQRSKVAVTSLDANVDPVGACVGAKGSRVRMIVSELRGEKVDIVEWKEDPAEFVANAISPAKVKEVIVDATNLTAEVIVPDNQLSLAIGKEGQNARLAAKLTGWRIDILSESQASDAAAMRAEREAAGESLDGEERQCRAITSSGHRCRNKAKEGSEFCGMPAHQKIGRMIETGEVAVEEVTPVEEGGAEVAASAEGAPPEDVSAGSESEEPAGAVPVEEESGEDVMDAPHEEVSEDAEAPERAEDVPPGEERTGGNVPVLSDERATVANSHGEQADEAPRSEQHVPDSDDTLPGETNETPTGNAIDADEGESAEPEGVQEEPGAPDAGIAVLAEGEESGEGGGS